MASEIKQPTQLISLDNYFPQNIYNQVFQLDLFIP